MKQTKLSTIAIEPKIKQKAEQLKLWRTEPQWHIIRRAINALSYITTIPRKREQKEEDA